MYSLLKILLLLLLRSSSKRRQIFKAHLHPKVSQTRLLPYAHSNSQLFRLRLNCSRVLALRMFERRPFQIQVEGPVRQCGIYFSQYQWVWGILARKIVTLKKTYVQLSTCIWYGGDQHHNFWKWCDCHEHYLVNFFLNFISSMMILLFNWGRSLLEYEAGFALLGHGLPTRH